tara:strand:- start:890 stop:1648 length:759 start_codon:yes stop_codon:yes gene_type:complete
MKSPIRSPLESKSLRIIKELVPVESTLSSFMLYSGDIELSLSRAGRTVVAHTNKQVVYDFWASLKKDKEKVIAAVEDFYPQIDSVLFHYLQESWPQYGDAHTRAAFFFILNRCSEYGEVSTGKMDKSHFNPIALNYLKNFEGTNFYPLWDKEENVLDTLSSAKQTDFTLMPVGRFSFNLFEYGKSRGYETTSVNHRELYEKMQQTDRKMILIYKKHSHLFRMYQAYNIHMIDKRGRVVNKKDECEEVVIANF